MFSSAFIGFLPNVSAITSLTQFGYRDATVASNAGMLYLGSLITWLHNNQTDILENQTLLLARVRFIRAPQAAFWCGISKNSWRGEGMLYLGSLRGFTTIFFFPPSISPYNLCFFFERATVDLEICVRRAACALVCPEATKVKTSSILRRETFTGIVQSNFGPSG